MFVCLLLKLIVIGRAAQKNHTKSIVWITQAIARTNWRPIGLQVTVRNGVVHLHGIIVNNDSRQAAIVAAENVAGVKEVHDHLCYVDGYSGFYVESPEDMKAAG